MYLPVITFTTTIIVCKDLFLSEAVVCRCSTKQVSWKVLKFTGILLCQSLDLNKFVGLTPATLSKKRFRHKCFPVNLVKFLRTRVLQTPLDDCLYPPKRGIYNFSSVQ